MDINDTADVYNYENDNGKAEIRVYRIFKGIAICYNSVHTDHFKKISKAVA